MTNQQNRPASTTTVSVTNPQKLIGLMFVSVMLAALMFTNTIGSEAGVPLLASIIGYLVGNGVGARSHTQITPALGNGDANERNG